MADASGVTMLKLLVLGDGGVGKSSMLITHTTGNFPSEYVPTVFDNYVHRCEVDGRHLDVAYWDTAGQEDYDRLRPLSYPQTDIFLLCYAIDSRDSFDNIKDKYKPEVDHYLPHVPQLVVGCKADLRADKEIRDIVTEEEGRRMAEELNLSYVETSSLNRQGLVEAFDTALRLGLHFMDVQPKKKRKFGFGFGRGKSKYKTVPLPPVMPAAGKAPWLEIETSTFADDWNKILQQPDHADVVFILDGKHRILAHKVLLSAASPFLAKVLGISQESNQLAKLEEDFSFDSICAGNVKGIQHIQLERSADKLKMMTVVTFDPDYISASAFSYVLQFLYTGVPNFPEDVSEEIRNNVCNICRLLHIQELITICENIANDEDFLNPSIGTYLNDKTGEKLKKMYFNKDKLADVVFNVEGTKVHAHKAVLSCRCEVMSAMIGANFSEGSVEISQVDVPEVPLEEFLALLEYLYTDHSPIEASDSVTILTLADRYCMNRLINLCELYITKEVDKSVTKNIEKSEIDVIGLLLLSQLHNAKQLEKWCLHFISTNFTCFQKRPEFPLLTGKNLEYVEENQWPPLSYLAKVEEYNAKYGDGKKGEVGKTGCSIM